MNSSPLISTIEPIISCNKSINPWCNESGAQQIIEFTFLIIILILGILGNLLVIFSIILDEKVYCNGNLFIINLAVADLLVTVMCVPPMIASVLTLENTLPKLACEVFGFVSVLTCSSSMWSLGFIALNRYWAVARRRSYEVVFSNIKVYVMMTIPWIWPLAVILPTILSCSSLGFDYKAMVCTWNNEQSRACNVLIILEGILIPLICTTFCYWQLFWYVRARRKCLNKRYSMSGNIDRSVKKRNLEVEVSLLKTLATAVFAFLLCWSPYSLSLMFLSPSSLSPTYKKIVTWLGVFNSTLNFIIYGVINRGYRQGYKRLFKYLFDCKMCKK